MLTEKMLWGAVPGGFRRLTDNRDNYLIVRQDRADEIDFSICCNPGVSAEQGRYHGRADLRVVRLGDGDTALVRSYRHGGLLRNYTGEWFFTWPPRPFRELAITEELRRRGLRTVEVYAACVHRIAGPIYRGWLITRELRESSDLWAAVQRDGAQHCGLRATLKAVAETLHRMHQEGVYHADLNLKNILVRFDGGAVHAYLIDFDKARLFLGRLPAALANKNLQRLQRSARKLDPERRFLSAELWNEFLDFYYGASEA